MKYVLLKKKQKMNKVTKRSVDFSSGKAVISVTLLPIVLNKYISEGEYEIFIREFDSLKSTYSLYINKAGKRTSYLYCIGKAKALTVLKVAMKYGINIANNNVNETK